MIFKYEVGFEVKYFGLYFGKFHYCYVIEKDAGKVYLALRFRNKTILVFKTFNKYIHKIWLYFINRKFNAIKNK